METQSVLVVPAGEEMELKVYVSTQSPTLVQVCSLHTSASLRRSQPGSSRLHSRRQAEVAETLDIPCNRVSCHVRRIGGAFGGKVTKTSILACITSVAAWK